MIFTVKQPVKIDIKFVVIDVPVKSDEEDMPNDFPFRTGDRWRIVVDIESGQIVDWPKGVISAGYMKVTDGGTYRLLDSQQAQHAAIEENYVPHGVVPGNYGDYIELDIDENGIITNWPKKPDVSEFFPEDDD